MIISFSSGEEKVISQIMELLNSKQFEVIEHKEESIITSLKIKLYSRENRVEVGNKNLVLGRRQFAMLCLLAKNPNRIFTKDEIYTYIWNDVVPINVEETVRYHISEIRKKMKKLCGENFIQTVWGIGYRFCETAENQQVISSWQNFSEKKDIPTL